MRRSEDINNEFFVHHIDTLVITQRMYTEQEILQCVDVMNKNLLLLMSSERLMYFFLVALHHLLRGLHVNRKAITIFMRERGILDLLLVWHIA